MEQISETEKHMLGGSASENNGHVPFSSYKLAL